jgi:hypothetical protein
MMLSNIHDNLTLLNNGSNGDSVPATVPEQVTTIGPRPTEPGPPGRGGLTDDPDTIDVYFDCARDGRTALWVHIPDDADAKRAVALPGRLPHPPLRPPPPARPPHPPGSIERSTMGSSATWLAWSAERRPGTRAAWSRLRGDSRCTVLSSLARAERTQGGIGSHAARSTGRHASLPDPNGSWQEQGTRGNR